VAEGLDQGDGEVIGDLIAGLIGKVIDRAWPDPTAKAAAALELAKLQQDGEFKAIDQAIEAARLQTDVNKVEAAHPSVFVSGWRPFIVLRFAAEKRQRRIHDQVPRVKCEIC
jgi:hypothetical protein